ncbi:MAG: hypothetical protein QOG71_3265 [Pyrinomonadaceae bacterium]|nr:hypothetical protein [Pyrinomonadaceae bacterium]
MTRDQRGASFRSEDLFRLIAERVEDFAVFAVDLDGMAASWNPGVEKLLGYSEAEFVGRDTSIIFTPEDNERGECRREMRVAAVEGRAEDRRWHVRQDGTRFWASGLLMALRDDAGALQGYAKILRDETAHKLTEDRLRESEAFSRDILESISDAFYALDREWRFTYLNQQCEPLIRRKREELIGKSIWEEFPEAASSVFYEQYHRALAEGVAVTFEAYYAPLEAWVEVRVYPSPAGLSVYFHDINERKRAEASLRDSQTRLALALQAGRAGTFEWNIETGTNVWSPELEALYGVPAGTFEGSFEAWAQRVVPEDAEAIGAGIRAAVAERRADYDYEFRAVLPDRSVRWLAGRARFEYDAESGQPLRMHGINVAIDERKRAEAERDRLEEQLHRRAEQLTEANRVKDEFLATLSHELRTPLTSILGWSRLLQTGNFDEAGTKRALHTIERNARAQAQLIDDLLDTSRIITGKLRLEVRPVDLASVVSAAAETARPAADAKDIRLQTLLDTQAAPISGDPDRLEQVVWNLLSNAIKFTPKGGRVQVRLERVNSHVEITVADTGRGIAPEFLPHVFDRFRQADQTTTRTHGGLGLGLAIVRQLVELHGGTVAVESEGEGRGTSFTVSLPLLPLRQETAEEDATGAHPAANRIGVEADCPHSLEGLRVLVVDDETDTRELLAAVLVSCGAEVIQAASAAEAFEQVGQARPNVLVTDIGMPEEDGYSLLARIRQLPLERGGKIPAVALTAYARAEDRVRALRSGFQMHVTKPITPAELITVVANLAGRIGGAQ